MPIPESQLQTWSNPGAVTTAQSTHESIRFALEDASTSTVKSRDFRCFLQGSYKNTTNIRGDSDVDLVVQCNEAFYSDLSGLSEQERHLFESTRGTATYLFAHFKADVLASLEGYYGSSNVSVGSKSLKLRGGSGRLPADVVPCFQYRRYLRFQGWENHNQRYVEGITFWAKDGRQVINYPERHYDNGVTKMKGTSNHYKPAVRMFKNARNRLIDKGRIPDKLAPSYFVECLLYNVPDRLYGASSVGTFAAVVNHLLEADMSKYVCQNEQLALFGTSPEQWSVHTARTYVNELVWLWNNWS